MQLYIRALDEFSWVLEVPTTGPKAKPGKLRVSGYYPSINSAARAALSEAMRLKLPESTGWKAVLDRLATIEGELVISVLPKTPRKGATLVERPSVPS